MYTHEAHTLKAITVLYTIMLLVIALQLAVYQCMTMLRKLLLN